MTTLYILDANSVFSNMQELADPFAPLPYSTLTPPPETMGTQVAFWTGSFWEVLPEYPQPAPPPIPTNAQQAESRKAAYTAEADPIYFMWQAGEATQAEWVAKREEIKARYPYYEEAA